MKKKYEVIASEQVTYMVIVEAESEDEARMMVEDMTLTDDDICDGSDFTIDEVSEVKE